jgi:multidrug resistance efflux pump
MNKHRGQVLEDGEPLARLENTLLDMSRVSTLDREHQCAVAELERLQASCQELERMLSSAREYRQRFLDLRKSQLGLEQSGLDAQLLATNEECDLSARELGRVRALLNSDAASFEEFDQRSAKVRQVGHIYQGFESRKSALDVLLQAASEGIDLTDPAPVALCRAFDLEQQIRLTPPEIESTRKRVSALERELTDARRQYDALSSASIAATSAGVVWKLWPCVGYLRQGDELLSAVDLRETVAEAKIPESQLANLHCGMVATVVAGDGRRFSAQVDRVFYTREIEQPSPLALAGQFGPVQRDFGIATFTLTGEQRLLTMDDIGQPCSIVIGKDVPSEATQWLLRNRWLFR